MVKQLLQGPSKTTLKMWRTKILCNIWTRHLHKRIRIELTGVGFFKAGSFSQFVRSRHPISYRPEILTRPKPHSPQYSHVT